MKSSDGGVSWVRQSERTRDNLTGLAVQDGLVIAVGGTSDHATILRSADAGLTWSVSELKSVGMLYGAALLDSQRGWAVGYQGAIVRTADGGLTWTIANKIAATDLFDISFRGEKGWAVGAGATIFGTGDGGLTWNLELTDSGQGSYLLLGITTAEGGRQWAIGENVLFYRQPETGPS